MFDALGTPSLGWNLLQAIRKVTDLPVRYNVVSHYHADHIYGLQAFKDHTSSIIVAQDRATEYRENEETSGERADQRLDQRRDALAPWVDASTRVVPPDITFKQQATLYLGGKRFVLIYAGPAHSASDSMMIVEPDGILFAGDVVQNSRDSIHECRRRRYRQLAAQPRRGEKARSEIHHSRPRPAVDQRGDGDRFHARLHYLCSHRDGESGRGLGRFRHRLQRDSIGRNTETCRHSTPTIAAMHTGFFWRWSDRSSKTTSLGLSRGRHRSYFTPWPSLRCGRGCADAAAAPISMPVTGKERLDR